MTTASEILARTATPETEPHILIGKDRVVVVPPELQVVAVQYDHNVETVIFDCPRYWDEHDLSELKICINYMRADKRVGEFYCNDVWIDKSDDTMIHFKWTIGGHLTEASGGISFLVCAKSSNELGEILNRWNSVLNQEMRVSPGLLATGSIEKLYPDGIMSILTRLDSLVHASSGDGPPTEGTYGALGVIYMDLNTKLMYKCVDTSDGVFTWELLDGADGTDGVSINYVDIEEIDDDGDKTYRMSIFLSDGNTQELEFTAPQGPQGIQGIQGIQGETGKSAYEYARDAGYEGTEKDFSRYLTSVSGARVGDILETLRADLDENWLLCNGDYISAEDYPELVKLLPTLPTDWEFGNVYRGSGGVTRINGLTYANGYLVAVGQYYDGSQYYARISYTTDPTGGWVTRDLWRCSNVLTGTTVVAYINGYWVIGGQYYDGSKYYARIARTTDITGDWTTKDLWSGSASAIAVHDIAYADGYLVAVGQYDDGSKDRARIAYASDFVGTWTMNDLWTATFNASISSIAYADGYWVVGGVSRESTSAAGSARIAYTTDPSGTWTTKDLWSGVTSRISCVSYANGSWVVGGDFVNNSTYYARLAYANKPNGTWTNKDLWSGTKDNRTVEDIIYAKGYWLLVGQYYDGSTYYARIAYTNDHTADWITNDLWSGGYANNSVVCAAYVDGYSWVVGGLYREESLYSATTGVCVSGTAALPAISDSRTYTYIKAKEV